MSDPRLLMLDPRDNVFVAIRAIGAGDTLEISGRAAVSADAIPLGFKIAARDIRCGEKILKYGTPIGSSTREIPAGETVHLHNMKSDYLPTFERGGRGDASH